MGFILHKRTFYGADRLCKRHAKRNRPRFPLDGWSSPCSPKFDWKCCVAGYPSASKSNFSHQRAASNVNHLLTLTARDG